MASIAVSFAASGECGLGQFKRTPFLLSLAVRRRRGDTWKSCHQRPGHTARTLGLGDRAVEPCASHRHQMYRSPGSASRSWVRPARGQGDARLLIAMAVLGDAANLGMGSTKYTGSTGRNGRPSPLRAFLHCQPRDATMAPGRSCLIVRIQWRILLLDLPRLGTPLKWHAGLTMAFGSRPDGIARMPARFTHGQYGPRTNLGFKSGISRTVDSGRGRASGNAQLKSPIPWNSVKSLTAHKKVGCCLHPRLTTCQNGISSSRSRP